MSRRPSALLMFLLALALLLSPAAAMPGQAQDRSVPRIQAGPVVTSDQVSDVEVPQRWIVQLDAAPLAQSPVAAQLRANGGAGPINVQASAALSYRNQLRAAQNRVLAAVRRQFPATQVHQRYELLFNGIGISVPGAGEAAMQRLSRIPGVVAVHPDRRHDLQMFSSIPTIGADVLWGSPAIGGQANAGRGVKIAVIDSGIYIDNPFFDPAGFAYPAGFPKGETEFTTPKVIAARAYFRPDLPPAEGSATPLPGPFDSSHGTHVAGSAAGNANTTAELAGIALPISGVAPAAYLMNYKTFYANDSPFSGSAWTIELVAALEDALADGADVINNSWGGRPSGLPDTDPSVIAAEAAVDAGVTVVFAAGNAGPDLSTHGSPSYSDKLISVGATTAGRALQPGGVDVVAPEGVPGELQGMAFSEALFGPELPAGVWGPFSYVSVGEVSDSTLACEPLPTGSLSGRVAMIERGVCPFSIKVLNAQIGGANSVIVYNSEAGGDTLVGMAPGDGSEAVGIPSIFVGRSDGLAMLNWRAAQGDAAQLQIDTTARIVDAPADVLAPFSSRGPTFQGSLKPDVVAPGVAILSAGFAAGIGREPHMGFGLSSGTSMATPHVSGAAALLKQIHPGWSPSDIKSALMNTADPNVYLDLDRSEATGVLEEGAGRIDLSRAAGTPLLFSRGSLSFGNVPTQPGQPTRVELAVTVRNVSGAGQDIAMRPQVGGINVSVAPASLALAAGATASFVVSAELPVGALGDYEGFLAVDVAGQQLRLPLWARALPPEPGPKVLLLDNDGSTSLELPDYSGYYGNALGELQIPFTYIDLDARAGEERTLPSISELQKHEVIIWFTGDSFFPDGSFPVPTPLTTPDLNALIAYLQSGGSLIATGQDFSWASDNNPNPDPNFGRSSIYHSYLGAVFVQDDVFGGDESIEKIVVGTGSQAWLANIRLDLSLLDEDIAPGDQTGAGNQVTIDEAAVINLDPRTPNTTTTPIFQRAAGGATPGLVGLNNSSSPTLEQPLPDFKYRTTYLAFGLEGVRSDTGATTRKELLQNLLFWTVDRPAVRVEGFAGSAAAGQTVELSAVAGLNTPGGIVRYRWDFGDGSPIVETSGPTVSHTYATAGNYQPRVEITTYWGHTAVSGQ
jgi:subtilisin family serine protease